jgi:hypothetical protein
VGLDLLKRTGDRYSLTPESAAFLVSSRPGDRGAFFHHHSQQEFLPNEDRTHPPHSLIFAVNMLVNTEAGDTYTVSEITAWLEEAGSAEVRLLEVSAPSPLILATKPSPARPGS